MPNDADARALADRSRHLAVARPAVSASREQALRQAREARRRLEQRDEGRFAYLRRAHD